MSNAIMALVDIVDRILDTYNVNERWVVKNLRSKYAK
jgi:hypothetical protein